MSGVRHKYDGYLRVPTHCDGHCILINSDAGTLCGSSRKRSATRRVKV